MGVKGKTIDFLPPFSQELLSKFKTFKASYEIHIVHKDKGKIQLCTVEKDYSF